MFGEALERRVKPVTLPRSVIERAGDRVTSLLCQPLHGRAFGDVLPNEAVRVFVRASLP